MCLSFHASGPKSSIEDHIFRGRGKSDGTILAMEFMVSGLDKARTLGVFSERASSSAHINEASPYGTSKLNSLEGE